MPLFRPLLLTVIAALVTLTMHWRPTFELVQPELFGAAGGQANA